VFQKPQQYLTRGTEFHELREHQLHGLLNATIWIFFQSLIRGFDVASRSCHNELAAASLLASRFHRTLSQ
jgi:hypothetical protein